MSLVRWDPYDELMSLKEGVNRLFSESTGGRAGMQPRSWAPACDIYETDEEVVITADLPGISKEDVKIELTGDSLTLSGERPHRAEKREGYHRLERVHGTFYRAFTLATEVDIEKIKATFDNGVLTLKLPKSDAVKPKQITIDVS
ncbi:MAG: hypothetical protein AUJ92_17425 [Armatimonadetes bacterium CG2_30_59_28]|nr:Hsp20/alpha crystallin family protein [Armatimonadota bacterium]OIO90993.1 MAG: hypothetical protein AUJ92_17425 [Armatimonadetes bacterium CG2_30_59_28]PIU66044.1 MAG: hypothetical protein COS85_06385 [Armatimonadetes bacterium CG07_land_8_20_14_0_80_59_28]PIX43649.1 MAG: hypothetical protein COZ56_06685 [Armatimonadetes bacterium CG_4_8_14_3_um_filter_58_9]PIY49488.1 MAG: hypothetical protein COZ05_00245 [Armatimonadetes bacterium CG_4_10_14_3_um_filter_59_10]